MITAAARRRLEQQRVRDEHAASIADKTLDLPKTDAWQAITAEVATVTAGLPRAMHKGLGLARAAWEERQRLRWERARNGTVT
jgi:hypothetical protein